MRRKRDASRRGTRELVVTSLTRPADHHMMWCHHACSFLRASAAPRAGEESGQLASVRYASRLMLCSLEVRLSFPCDACDTGLPINGPVPMTKCLRCLEVTTLTGERAWSQLLSPTVFLHALRHTKPGETTRSEGQRLNRTTTLRFPRCPACGKEHEARPAKVALMKHQPLTCPCGTQLPLQAVPEAFASALPFVKALVDAELLDDSTTQAPVSSGPVVMACMKCQASLPVDGTRRLVECGYCTARNDLPDDLWLALHPAAKRESWFILFDAHALLDSVGQ